MIGNDQLPFPLPTDEVTQLFVKFSNGDIEARQKIVNHNLRLVVKIANKYYNYSELTDDLISIGVIGLMKGVNGFDHQRKTKFSTFAGRCIANEINMYLRKYGKKDENVVNFEDTISFDDEGNGLKVGDVVCDEQADIFEIFISNEECVQLRTAIESLSEPEKTVIKKRFGIDCTKMSQVALSEELGYSRRRIKRIQIVALEKIKKSLVANQQTVKIKTLNFN